MLKSNDVVVLLWLAGRKGAPPTFEAMVNGLHADRAGIHRSISRLRASGLLGPDRNVELAQADEFLAHSLRYLFPPTFGGEARGIPTAWAVAPLSDLLAGIEGQPYVWPHPEGTMRGIAIEPLHRSVPEIALRDPALHRRLALAEALRIGDARIRKLAREELRKDLAADPSQA